MQRAENVPDAFFRFTLGKHPFLRCSRQKSRSARFSGARNKPHTTRPTPRSFRSVQPSPPTRQILATDSKSFCRVFVPQPFRGSTNWQSGKFTKCALIQTSLLFRLSVCDAQKPRNGGNFRDRMQLYNRSARTAIRLPPGQGCAPTPANASRPAKNSAYRSPFPNSSNRKSRGPAPLAWVPIL